MQKYLYALLILVLSIEVLIRISFKHITTESERVNIDFFTTYTPLSDFKYEIKPYLTFINRPFFKNEFGIQHNSWGLRQQDEPNINNNALRILCLGGSTTYGSEVDEANLVWPKVLESKLRENCDEKINIYNGGINGGTSAEMLTHFQFKYQNLNPDIVIIHSGINDLRPSFIENYSSDYSHWRVIKHQEENYLNIFEKLIIKYSKTAFYIYAKALNNKIPSGKGILYIEENEKQADFTKEQFQTYGFENNLENLFYLLNSKSIKTIYFQVPISQVFKNKLEEIDDKGMRDRLLNQYFVLRDTAKNICKKHDILFVEMESANLEDNFIDMCHLNEEGHVIKSEFLYNALNTYICY